MRHGSLFSGIGGFDLAAEWMGWENVFQVEWDKYCQRVLAKNFPNVKRYGDIKEFDGTKYRGLIDIISGGFPCQPFSQAGKRKGKQDDRFLWPEMLRVIGEIKPTFIVGENVAGLISMENGKTLDRILLDLANKGYTTEQFIIPACGVGTWHRRERIWILAYSINYSNRADRGKSREKKEISELNRKTGLSGESSGTSGKISADSDNSRCGIHRSEARSRKEYPHGSSTRQEINSTRSKSDWTVEPELGRVANGIPNRVDRLKGLGNAVVPQVVYQIFKAIEQTDKLMNNGR